MGAIDELRVIMTTPGAGAAAPVEVDPDSPLWERFGYVFNPHREFPDLDTFALMGDRPALPRRGVITFSGKPKQGKSTAVRALLIPLFTGEKFDTLTPRGEKPNLAITFDMEMPERSLVKRTLATMEQIDDERGQHYGVVPLSAVPVKERMAKISAYVAEMRPDIVIVDQIGMLVEDYNDPKEALKVKAWMIELGKSCSLWCIIHQNKDPNNRQMKGHLGTVAGEGNDENYSVVNSNGVFTITPETARETCIDSRSAKVKFSVEDGAMIVSADAREALAQWEKAVDAGIYYLRMFEDAGKEELSYTEIKIAMAADSGADRCDKEEWAAALKNAENRLRKILNPENYPVSVLYKAGSDRKAKYRINPKILLELRPDLKGEILPQNPPDM